MRDFEPRKKIRVRARDAGVCGDGVSLGAGAGATEMAEGVSEDFPDAGAGGYGADYVEYAVVRVLGRDERELAGGAGNLPDIGGGFV